MSTSTVPFFSKLSEGVEGILDKGFHGEKVSVSVNTKTENGTGLNTELKRARSDAPFGGSFKYKYAIPDSNGAYVEASYSSEAKATLSATFDKVRPGLEAVVATEFTLNEKFDKDPRDPKATDKVEGKLNYSSANFALTGKFGRERSGLNSAQVSVAAGHKGFTVGGDCAVEFKTVSARDVTACNAGAQYKANDFSLTGYIREKLVKDQQSRQRTAEFNYLHNVNKDLAVAATFSHNFPRLARDAEDKEIQMPSSDTYTVGAQSKLDNGATLKAKIDNKALLSLSYMETIRPSLKLTVSGEVDVRRVSAGKIGAALSYGN
jgi:hypothetical protein